MEVVFWISLFVLFYTYLGYGLLLSLLQMTRRNKKKPDSDYLLPVTMVVPAYNEEAVLEQKIQNCLALNYPEHLLTLLFITDGSTDKTSAIVKKYPSIQHLHLPKRQGKTAALNRAMLRVSTPVVAFTDANALLHPDSLLMMVRHFSDESIGGVSGEKRIIATDDTAVGTGERIYWQYESMLKKADASFYTVIGAAGELFSIRTALFEPLNEAIILDDFVLSAMVCLKGYRFAYEEKAFALEAASQNMAEEQKRKVRISAGCFQALVLLKALLNPFRQPRLFFQYVSHRVFRWLVCPLLVPLLFGVNAVLAYKGGTGYVIIFGLQCLFYLLAAVGWLLKERKGLPRVLFIPYYFVFMNFSLYAGFFYFLTKKQSAVWKKSARKMVQGQNDLSSSKITW